MSIVDIILNLFQSIDLKVLLDNILVIITVRLLILLLFLKVAHYLIDFFSRNIIKNLNDYEREKQIKTIMLLLKSTVDIVISLIFIMAFLTRIGVDIRPILTAAGVLGVAVGFGAKRFVEDIISGIIIILEGQVRVGDVIEISGKLGTVEKLNLKMIVLRDQHGRVHYIRNGMVDIVTNFTRDFSYAVFEIGVSYNSDTDYVINAIKEIFNDDLMKNPEMNNKVIGTIEVYGLESFGDSAINIKYRIKTKPMEQWAISREFNKLIKKGFDQRNIEIPFPQRTIHIQEQENK